MQRHITGIQGGVSAICISLLMALALPAHAEDKGNREREALRRTQQSLRQAQQEREALEGEKANLAQAKDQLSGELKQTSAKVKGAEVKAAQARARADQLEASLRDKDKALSEAQTREADLQARLTQSQSALAEKARLAESLTLMLKTSTADVRNLKAQNEALYANGRALIDLYRSDSPSAWLKGADVPLGLREVRVENLAEVMRSRLDEARYKEIQVLAEQQQ